MGDEFPLSAGYGMITLVTRGWITATRHPALTGTRARAGRHAAAGIDRPRRLGKRQIKGCRRRPLSACPWRGEIMAESGPWSHPAGEGGLELDEYESLPLLNRHMPLLRLLLPPSRAEKPPPLCRRLSHKMAGYGCWGISKCEFFFFPQT